MTLRTREDVTELTEESIPKFATGVSMERNDRKRRWCCFQKARFAWRERGASFLSSAMGIFH